MTECDEYRPNELLSVTTEQAGWKDEPSLLAVDPFATRTFELSSADLLRGLAELGGGRSRDGIETTLQETLDLSADEAADLFAQLVEAGLLRSGHRRESRVDAWDANGWQPALEYHEYVRDYQFIDEAVEESEHEDIEGMETEIMQTYRAQEEPPAIYREYDVDERIELPSPEDADRVSVADALSTSLFGRADPADGTLDERTLSAVLFYAFGETGTLQTEHQGPKLTKPVPSGGARHPTEGYVAVFDGAALPAGVYHYSVRDHALERLSDTAPEKPLLWGIDADPAALIGCSSVVERSMWRYREPRTYRVLLHDIGHVLETLRLTARAHGVSTMTGFKFDDDYLEELFGLEHADEPLLAYATLSTDQ
ncbi:SagB/ThcOx family dehydrogenase [Halopiger djelfimassiliensis]|uniref:SagB/ThcOx family dehydrogenase n=1 Tax=Halopiger djelfimassiliensis TaxID=1293047 RepID=UPI000677D961|nr:SagB/ThcOx family dehydrogenase [Halopiger djelfimassiliensis]